MTLVADFSGAKHIHHPHDLTIQQQEIMNKAGYKTCVFHIENNGRIFLEGNGGYKCVAENKTFEEVIEKINKSNKETESINGFKSLLGSYVNEPKNKKVAKFSMLQIVDDAFVVFDSNMTKHTIPIDFSQSEIENLANKLNLAIQEVELTISQQTEYENRCQDKINEFKRLYKKSLKTKRDLENIESLKLDIKEFLPKKEYNQLINGIF